MIWRNGNDIKRKEETDDIINACYQNEDEISECLQELKFSSSSTLNRETESFKDENLNLLSPDIKILKKEYLDEIYKNNKDEQPKLGQFSFSDDLG